VHPEFVENDEFGLGNRHVLGLEQQISATDTLNPIRVRVADIPVEPEVKLQVSRADVARKKGNPMK
jgi:hypothetical protein